MSRTQGLGLGLVGAHFLGDTGSVGSWRARRVEALQVGERRRRTILSYIPPD